MPDVSAARPPGSAPTTAMHLCAYTTLRLGGPAGRMLTAVEADEITQGVRELSARGEPVLVLGGGSNVVVSDQGIPGTVLLIRSRGVRVIAADDAAVTVRVEAGEPWDEVVAAAVDAGWSGIECLSGIPGGAGATPIQNVGAYGQEVAETITAVRVYDRITDEVTTMRPAGCGFGYRTSVFKRSDRWVVLSADFRLRRSRLSTPVRYAELAHALGVAVGARVPLQVLRDAVLALRSRKGMVLDSADPDTYSVGSFFTNPVIEPAALHELRRSVGAAGHVRAAGDGAQQPPSWPQPDGLVKVSAAWLIESAGYRKGYGRRGVSISSKHTLALTNRGAGTTTALLELAREIRDGVHARSGVTLSPEPVLVGCAL